MKTTNQYTTTAPRAVPIAPRLSPARGLRLLLLLAFSLVRVRITDYRLEPCLETERPIAIGFSPSFSESLGALLIFYPVSSAINYPCCFSSYGLKRVGFQTTRFSYEKSPLLTWGIKKCPTAPLLLERSSSPSV